VLSSWNTCGLAQNPNKLDPRESFWHYGNFMKFVPISFQILTMPQHPRTQPLLLEERHVQTCSIKLDASEKGVPERKKTMLNKTMLGEMLSWVYDEGMLVLEIVCGKASGRLCELVSAVC